jgi:hypothetical protein
MFDKGAERGVIQKAAKRNRQKSEVKEGDDKYLVECW